MSLLLWVLFILFVIGTITCLIVLFYLRSRDSSKTGPKGDPGPEGKVGPAGPPGTPSGVLPLAENMNLAAFIDGTTDGAEFIPPPAAPQGPLPLQLRGSLLSTRLTTDPKLSKNLTLLYQKTGNIVTLSGQFKLRMTTPNIARFRVHITLPASDPVLTTVPYQDFNPNVVSWIGNAWTEYATQATRQSILMTDVQGSLQRLDDGTTLPGTQTDRELMIVFNVVDGSFFTVVGDKVPIHVYFQFSYIAKSNV